jgi:hypothetical protein
MKIYFITLAFALLYTLPLLSQSSAPDRRFEGGLILGVNLAQIDGDMLHGYNKPGFHVGAKVDAVLTERWRAGIEFLYVQQGASRNKQDDPFSVHDRIHLNMVEVPLMAHFRDWKVQASAGFSYARIINSEVIWFDGTDATDQYDFDPDVYSIILGGSFRFTERWTLDIRWSRWLNNILPDDYEPFPNGEFDRFIGKSINIRGIYTF